jgi:hypothetical protein
MAQSSGLNKRIVFEDVIRIHAWLEASKHTWDPTVCLMGVPSLTAPS